MVTFLLSKNDKEAHTHAKVSEEQAITSALNQRLKTRNGYKINNPAFSANFSIDSWNFNPVSGAPHWQWKLTSINTSKISDFDVSPSALNQVDISYQRGLIVEQYITQPDAVEQQFLIKSPLTLTSDDLVIEGEIQSDGEFVKTAQGWLWQNSQGVVSLGKVTVIDAEGKLLPAYMKVSAQRSSIIVDGKALASAAYPVLIDPVVGTNDFRISTMGPDGNVGYLAADPAIAYNSTNNEYLVVWEGDDNTAPLVDQEIEIFGQRINASTGALLGSRIRISDLGTDGDTAISAESPSVAYSSVEDEYLVCWSGDDDTAPAVDNEFEIYCNYVKAADGSTPFVIIKYSDMGNDGSTSHAAFNPDITYNTTENEYLLVWEGTDNSGSLVPSEFEIFGQRIDSVTGNELGTNDFRISDMNIDGDADFDACRYSQYN